MDSLSSQGAALQSENSNWDFNSSSDQLIISTVFSLNSPHELQVFYDSSMSPMRQVSVKEESPKVNVWTLELPRSELRRGTTRLAITWMRGIWKIEEAKAYEEKAIDDECRFAYLFHFSPSFPNDEPKNQVESCGLQLIYFFKHFMMEQNYQSIIPQLVLQYLSLNPRPNAVEKKPIYECIDYIFQTEHHLCADFTGCVLAVIGALTYRGCNRAFQRGEQLLSLINVGFLSQLVRCKMPEFVSAIINGAAHCLFSLNGVSSQVRQAAITQLLQCDSINRDFISQALESDNNIQRHQLGIWLAAIQKINEPQLARKLLMRVDGYFAMFKVLQVFDKLLDIPVDEKFFQQVCEKVGNKISADELLEVLEIVSTGSTLTQNLFYLSSLPNIIQGKLKKPEQSNLSLYKHIYGIHFYSRLVKNVKKRDFLLKMCESRGFSFAYLVNEFQPRDNDLVEMFEKWMKSNCDGASADYHDGYNIEDSEVTSECSYVIKTLDQELFQLISVSQLPLLSQKAIEHFNKRFPLSSRSLNYIVKAIDSVKLESLKLVYVSHQDVLSCIGRNKLKAGDLLRENQREQLSWTREQLLKFALAQMTPPSYEEVERNFIGPEEIDIFWVSLMRDFRNYAHSSLAINIQTIIKKFTDLALTNSLLISQFLQLSSRSQTKLQTIYLLMAQAKEREDEVERYKANLQASFSLVKTIDRMMTQLHHHVTVVVSESDEKAVILKDIQTMQSRYRFLPLNNFNFSTNLQILCESSEIALGYVELGLFQKMIEKVKAVKAITIKNCKSICLDAIARVEENVSSLLRSLSEESAEQILDVLSLGKHRESEIDLLIILKPNLKEKLIILKEGIKYYDNRKQLAENCKSLIKMKEVISLIDVRTLDVAERWVNYVESVEQHTTIGPLSFEQMMNLYRETRGYLFPEGNADKYKVVFEVIHVLAASQDLTSFLKTLSGESLRALIESADDYDESTVTLQLIFKLEMVWNFYQQAKKAKTCSQLVTIIEEKLGTQELDLKGNIIECSNNIFAIKDQIMTLERNEMAKRMQIDLICQSSSLSFTRKGEKLAVSVIYSDKNVNLSYLRELKERASLSLHASKGDDLISQTLVTFIKFVQVTQRTVETLVDLYDSGYPIDIANQRKFSCRNGNFEDLSEFQTMAAGTLLEWRNVLKDAYMRYYPLTFLFGQQFWILETHLYGTTQKEAVSLLSYLQCTYQKMPKQKVVSPPADRLNLLGKFLDQLQSTETHSQNIAYEASANAKIKAYPGQVVYISVPPDRVLAALVSIYLNSGRAFPQAYQIMRCSRLSPWPEVQAFLYRCITSKRQEMFVLIGTEQLSVELQAATRNLFAKLVEDCIRKDRFSLAVITVENNSLLSEYFQLLQDPKCERVKTEQLLREEILMKYIPQIVQQTYNSPTIVVSSSTAGQGKSTWIQRQAAELRMPLRKFPIAGHDLKNICSRLMEVVQPDIALHLTLSHVENHNELNDLLTCICLLRTIKAGNVIIVFPSTCKIFIEVQNLQPPLQLSFLHYLPQKVVLFDIREICLTKKSKRVLAYLQLYETNTLVQGDANRVQVTSEMAVSLLTKYFIGPQSERGQPLSFLAVQSFINVLSVLLKGMEQSPFTPEVINYMIRDAKTAGVPQLQSEYENLRGKIVKSFLHTCEEVTTRCLTQVLRAQEQALRQIVAESNFECTVKWDKSNHFSMIFLRDGSYAAIYRKQEDVPSSLKKLIYIQSSSLKYDAAHLMQTIIKGNYAIPDYTNLTHVEALSYLQQIYARGRDLVADSKT